MTISLSHPTQIVKGEIKLTASKSESNRGLVIQALCKDSFEINNLSNSDDSIVLQKLLYSQALELDVHFAGTAMRFLTAYKAIKKGEYILTGSPRMKERPIKILVEALRTLGGDIEYMEEEGFPPLKIAGKELEGGEISLDGGVSSQYVSALLMIAPKFKKGLQINFLEEIISKPYIDMTIKMMQYFGAKVYWRENSIVVEQGEYVSKYFEVEGDWSAASYWYSIAALSKEADITLIGLKEDSLQGDSEVQNIYKNFGVETEFVDSGIRLIKSLGFKVENSELKIDFINFPDIAQTVAVTCAALNVPAKLTGLKTLRIKETDRIVALKTELEKMGCSVLIDNDDLMIKSGITNIGKVKTYNDHRMAMAFAPLALINEINIMNPEVVKKSYPNFWDDLECLGGVTKPTL